ncbi:hypothetical protein SCP_0306160 [Sparassis crispa]|uniref:Uncharacterized protein n=1 Tax=Sparassis crispa TaxID=139825 RepID=A0A401GFJ0_9APHY|nr:hypothetical protein SCP_0306160 [Sparassis crispa]GBE80895.1 hypothetical protein SCP_0306160 [Sparassis crispa]
MARRAAAATKSARYGLGTACNYGHLGSAWTGSWLDLRLGRRHMPSSGVLLAEFGEAFFWVAIGPERFHRRFPPDRRWGAGDEAVGGGWTPSVPRTRSARRCGRGAVPGSDTVRGRGGQEDWQGASVRMGETRESENSS